MHGQWTSLHSAWCQQREAQTQAPGAGPKPRGERLSETFAVRWAQRARCRRGTALSTRGRALTLLSPWVTLCSPWRLKSRAMASRGAMSLYASGLVLTTADIADCAPRGLASFPFCLRLPPALPGRGASLCLGRAAPRAVIGYAPSARSVSTTPSPPLFLFQNANRTPHPGSPCNP